MKKRQKAFSISEMYCCECGNRGIPIPRRNGRYKEPGHLKKIFCFDCKKETNHAECKEGWKYSPEDFRKEFESGRFINGERVPISKLESCKEDCQYNIDGRCWNANCSFICLKRVN